MKQKSIRPYNGQIYSKDEGANIIDELDKRTKSSDEEYNSIQRLGERVKEHSQKLNAVVFGYQGPLFIAGVPQEGGGFAPPTENGDYRPIDEGTYPDAGGLVYAPSTTDKGKDVKFIKSSSIWTKSAIDMPKGEPGSGFNILDRLADESELPEDGSLLQGGYLIPINGVNHIFLWASSINEWIDAGAFQGERGADGGDAPQSDSDIFQ